MIHVICTDISGLGVEGYSALYARASRERQNRADRYRDKADALRCLTAEALLRYALGATDFSVGKAPDGKPFIQGKPGFYYNLSHSGRWVVIACGDHEVGVDVEQIREDTDIQAIASRFYTPEEQHYVWADFSQSRRRFFEVWTGKESYLKYLGIGLKRNLTSFSILHLEPEVKLHHRKLGSDYSLSLCTTEHNYVFSQVAVLQLLKSE